jgi:hypothetical protein
MLILIGLGFVAWVGVFAFLWEWALNHVDSALGALIPISWLILTPCILIQFCIWWR